MPNLEAWNHSLCQSAKEEVVLRVVEAAKLLKPQQTTISSLRVRYHQDVEKYMGFSCKRLKLRAMSWTAPKIAKVARGIMLLSAQSLAHLHNLRAAPWPLLLVLLADCWRRKALPRGPGRESLNVPDAVLPWSPWTGLAPPVVPALVQRQ
jgi:hypothetical protein